MYRNYSKLVFIFLFTLAPVVLPADEFTVYTVNYPLQYFTQRIAKDRVQVIFPAPANVDPAFWMPERDIVQAYQRADLVVLNGADYAAWINRVSLPRGRQVVSASTFNENFIPLNGVVTHNHGPSGEHSHTGTAFVTWLDFSQAVQQARAISDALSKALPRHRLEFEKNFTGLRSDLMMLDLELQQIIAAKSDLHLFASHPVYHYLARRYQLKIQDMVWEPDQMPNTQQWQAFRLARESFPAVWMLWEKPPSREITDKLVSEGMGVIVYDPCANRPARGDFLSVMKQNIANLKQAYSH